MSTHISHRKQLMTLVIASLAMLIFFKKPKPVPKKKNPYF